MSSLALQLFVNLNKLIQPQSCAGLGSHYAKYLVENLRQKHPQLLAGTDPSNAHTDALSAFALGIGLRELRHEGAHHGVIESVAGILKTALGRADEALEHLAEEEVHLLLQAHEDYKTHLGVRNEPSSIRARMGATRGAADVLPMATTAHMGPSLISWRDPESTQAPPLHASDIDIGPLELRELSQAITGDASFLTNEATFDFQGEGRADPFDIETDPGVAPRHGWPDDGIIESVIHGAQAEHATPALSPEVMVDRAFAETNQLLRELGDKPTPMPKTMPSAGAIPTLHPVRLDRHAEREFSDDGELPAENIDSMLARKRMQETGRRQEIPLHGSWEGPEHVRHAERVHARGSLPEESEWSEASTTASTYLHSESAPDSSIITRGKKKAPIPPVVWAAPTFIILPPVAVFYGGVLWGRREYGQGLFALSLGIAGAGGMLAAWLML